MYVCRVLTKGRCWPPTDCSIALTGLLHRLKTQVDYQSLSALPGRAFHQHLQVTVAALEADTDKLMQIICTIYVQFNIAALLSKILV